MHPNQLFQLSIRLLALPIKNVLGIQQLQQLTTYPLLEVSRSLIGRLQAEGDRETLRDRARREFEAWSNRPKGSTSLSLTLDWDLAKPEGPESWRREFRDFCLSILPVNGIGSYLDPLDPTNSRHVDFEMIIVDKNGCRGGMSVLLLFLLPETRLETAVVSYSSPPRVVEVR